MPLYYITTVLTVSELKAAEIFNESVVLFWPQLFYFSFHHRSLPHLSFGVESHLCPRSSLAGEAVYRREGFRGCYSVGESPAPGWCAGPPYRHKHTKVKTQKSFSTNIIFVVVFIKRLSVQKILKMSGIAHTFYIYASKDAGKTTNRESEVLVCI